MRTAILALALVAASGSAWACPAHPQQTAGNDQVVASSGNQAPSTPIPPRQSQGGGKS
ncbi:hypothetical protein [Benzoatithermus flavus]|uniref:Lipoprotein n=1 Tax=Benzoatithermus flavus TaxID=3108223 RepID=A0ABU8XWG6_9PROT